MLKNSSHPVANEICQSVKNAVKALKDGFLKELHVVFYPGPESNEIVEMYKFLLEKKKTKECVLSLSASGLDQIVSNIQMDELADQTSTLDITQSSSAKKRKTYVGNTPANKKGNSTKPNASGQLKKRNTTSNTPGKIKKRSPLKVTLKKKSKVGSKQTKRFNI